MKRMRKQAERHAAAAADAVAAAGDVTPAEGPQSSAARPRAPRQPTATGEALADALKKTLADLQNACDEGYRILSAAGAANAYGVHGVALVGVRSALQDALAALEQAKHEPNAPAAELALAPEAWGGNALHPVAPACLQSGSRRKQASSFKAGATAAAAAATAAASGEGKDGAGENVGPEAEQFAKVYKEPCRKKPRTQPLEKHAAEAAAEPPKKRPHDAPSSAEVQMAAGPPAATGRSVGARTIARPGARPGLAAAKPAGAPGMVAGTQPCHLCQSAVTVRFESGKPSARCPTPGIQHWHIRRPSDFVADA